MCRVNVVPGVDRPVCSALSENDISDYTVIILIWNQGGHLIRCRKILAAAVSPFFYHQTELRS
jgi:hypothetical protein